MSRYVLKFGGSSVGDESNFFDSEHLTNIASTVKGLKDAGNDVVVVISAMAGATRRLKNMCMSVHPSSNTPEDDLVLATGEQITTALLSKLLSSDFFGIKTQTFMGWQIPIITNTAYGDASILSVESKALEECLKNQVVPIVAGFQGVTQDHQITTLGFDGSDTSAVAVASAIKADICQFYKDVRGIYTANPRRVPNAKKVEIISTYEMFVLSSLGARILHPRSLKTAMDNKITLRIVPNFDNRESGTDIINDDTIANFTGVTYFEHNQSKITLSVVSKSISPNDISSIIKTLNKNKIFAELVNTEFDSMSVTVEIGWIEQLNTALQSIHSLFGLDSEENPELPAFTGGGKQIYRDPAIKTGKT